MQKLFLLDAYALIYRAYYALIASPRINSKGQNTSAIYGFVGTLDEVIRTERPDYLGIAFDPAGGTFRHEAYPEYKAQRDATPEDIHAAVPVIKSIIQAYGIPILEVPGYEADDVIGTLATEARRQGLEVHMLTPDKDYAQLVADGIYMRRPRHRAPGFEKLGPEEVCAKYGIERPTQVIDLLGLMGDAADNIPGCPGVGEKTAAKLIGQYGSIDNLLAHTDSLKGAIKRKVEENEEQIRFSRYLVTIKTDCPIPLDLEALRLTPPDTARLRPLYEALEFRTYLRRLDEAEAPQATAETNPLGPLFAQAKPVEEEVKDETPFATLADVPHHYHLVQSTDEAQSLAEQLLQHTTVAVDTETTSVHAIDARLVGMSFAIHGDCAWYVAVPADENEAQQIVELFRPVYQSTTITKVGQNLKYDYTVLAHYGIHLDGPLFDTMLAHYLVQPELPHGMDYLSEVYLHYRTIHIDALLGAKGKAQKTMADIPPADICNYACEDAHITLRLAQPLQEELQQNGLTDIFRHIEMPLMPVLARMEMNGVRLDEQALAQTGRQFSERMQALEADIYTLAGHPFLLTSPRQVGEVLFGELQLDAKAKKTKTGQYSTSEEVLEKLKAKHPIVDKILRHRALKKLLSTYIDALPRLVNPRTGRIHTSFNQAVTATGRLSSSNPNLQNIPVRGDDGREIRKAFVPENGCTFLSADYSQIELRLMAHLSADPHLVADFRQGHDIHAATAAHIFHKPIEAVERDERRKAKTANFGIIYGISAFGLAERMEVSRSEAKALIEGYFATYPGVKAYMTQSIERARGAGYIETLFHRRRYLPDIHSRNATVRGYAERNAINAPIQGTAADIIKLAMIRIDERMRREHLRSKMILQVHDELNFSVVPDEREYMRHLVKEEMEHACALSVPLIADCGEGQNWLEAH